MPRPDILLVIPCFKERLRLPLFLRDLSMVLTERQLVNIKIQAVDDGSGEEEAAFLGQLVSEMRERYPDLVLPALRLPMNQGKGGAIYSAWDRAADQYDVLGFVDADGAVPAREVARLADYYSRAECTDLTIIAVRDGKGGTTVNRMWHRRLLSRAFSKLVRALFRLPFPDTQCGLKFVPAASYQKVRPHLTERRFTFDVDLLSQLVRAGAEIQSVSIDWKEVPGSRLGGLRGILNMFLGLMRLRQN